MSISPPQQPPEHRCLDCGTDIPRPRFGPFPLRCPGCRTEHRRGLNRKYARPGAICHPDRRRSTKEGLCQTCHVQQNPEARAIANEHQRKYRRERYASDPEFRARVLATTARWKERIGK